MYGYVLQDPVNFVDPDGHQAIPLPVILPVLGDILTGIGTAIGVCEAQKEIKKDDKKDCSKMHRSMIDGCARGNLSNFEQCIKNADAALRKCLMSID